MASIKLRLKELPSDKNIGHIISENTFMMCPTFLLNFVGVIRE